MIAMVCVWYSMKL